MPSAARSKGAPAVHDHPVRAHRAPAVAFRPLSRMPASFVAVIVVQTMSKEIGSDRCNSDPNDMAALRFHGGLIHAVTEAVRPGRESAALQPEKFLSEPGESGLTQGLRCLANPAIRR